MQVQVHQLKPPETAAGSCSSTWVQSFLFCSLMADLPPAAPRALRFWISAELGGPSTPWKFAEGQGAPLPPMSQGEKGPPGPLRDPTPLGAFWSLCTTEPNPPSKQSCWNSSQPTLTLRPQRAQALPGKDSESEAGISALSWGPDPGGSCQAAAMQKSSFASSVPNICAGSRPPPWQPGLCCLPVFSFFIFFKLCVNIYTPSPVPRSC